MHNSFSINFKKEIFLRKKCFFEEIKQVWEDLQKKNRVLGWVRETFRKNLLMTSYLTQKTHAYLHTRNIVIIMITNWYFLQNKIIFKMLPFRTMIFVVESFTAVCWREELNDLILLIFRVLQLLCVERRKKLFWLTGNLFCYCYKCVLFELLMQVIIQLSVTHFFEYSFKPSSKSIIRSGIIKTSKYTIIIKQAKKDYPKSQDNSFS